MSNNKTLILYHTSCMDGFVSAFIARQFLDASRVDLKACDYSQPVPSLTGYENVYILDFSWAPEILLPAIVEVTNVIMLDHHESAFKRWAGVELPENLYINFNKEKSGVGLTWDFFHSDKPMPILFSLVQSRDLWKKEVRGCMALGAALYSMGFVQSANFEEFADISTVAEHDDAYIDKLISEGNAILRQTALVIGTINERCGHDVEWTNFRFRAVNIPYEFASQCGDMLAPKYDFVLMYEDQHDIGKRKFSLRSTKGSGINVAEIAEQFGGGGHENAAGFYTGLNDPMPY